MHFSFSIFIHFHKKKIDSFENIDVFSPLDFPLRSILHEPREFEAFLAGAYDDYYSITIADGAHEDILSQPKNFANSTIRRLTFVYEVYNHITIKTQLRVVEGTFINGTQVTRGIPSNYELYMLKVSKDVKVVKEDINAICQWTTAKYLEIAGDNMIAFELQQRGNQLKELSQLQEISIDFSYRTYMKLRVKSFVDALKSLHKITFNTQSISKGRFDMFVKSQTVPVGWKCKTAAVALLSTSGVIESHSYECTKNH